MAIGMTKEQFHELARSITDALALVLREENRRDIDARMLDYRRAVSVSDHWCCRDMQVFAVKVWNANAPCSDAQEFGSVGYQLRGYHVNFCPFCGVQISDVGDAVRRSA